MKIELSEPTINAIKDSEELDNMFLNREITTKEYAEQSRKLDGIIASRVKANYYAETA